MKAELAQSCQNCRAKITLETGGIQTRKVGKKTVGVVQCMVCGAEIIVPFKSA